MKIRRAFLMIDTEVTQCGKVYDFAALVVDRKGNVLHSIAAVVLESRDKVLFHNGDAGIFGRSTLNARHSRYDEMVADGRRIVASVASINHWLAKVSRYNHVTMTAYNLGFDMEKMRNTGIMPHYDDKFCLWNSAAEFICSRKTYKQFALDNHLFGARTERGNMTIKTDAESVGHFLGCIGEEPHTALEDLLDWELPILKHLMKRKRNFMKDIPAYSWKRFIVKDNYKAA